MPPVSPALDAEAPETREALDILTARIETLLPETYADTYEGLTPTPMRSAALKYDADGRVAWGDIWQSFCDLALAGGPPHRGTLLEPASAEAIAANLAQHEVVVAELCRGLHLVTGLHARPAGNNAWVHIDCTSAAMSAWLTRAILLENVAARSHGLALELPAGPHFRLEKEIKNVIVAMAKTTHYWLEHMEDPQHVAINSLLRVMNAERPLLEPDWSTLPTRWRAIPCATIQQAVWLSRALVAVNTTPRRENSTVLLPVNERIDSTGETTTRLLTKLQPLAPH